MKLPSAMTSTSTSMTTLAARLLCLCGLIALVGLFGAACSGGSDDGSSASGERSVAVDPLFAVLDNEGRKVIGTADGYSLYIFDGDGLNESTCLDTCALTFIPFESPSEPRTAGDGVDSALVDVFERSDGVNQMTYGGRALYRFSADSEPGDSAGEGSAGRWHLVSPLGVRVPRLN